MHKLFKHLLVLTLALLPGMSLLAASITVDGFTYTTQSGNKLRLTVGPTTGDVVIPDTVVYDGTVYTVTEVYNKAFQKAQITSVVMPATVTKIGTSAFEACTKLAAVTFSPALTSIGSSSFKGCTSLTSIDLPQTLTTLSMYAFDGCTGLTEVVIPDKVTSLSGYPFQNCSKLTKFTIGGKMSSFSPDNIFKNSPIAEVYVSAASTKFVSVDGVVYNKARTTINFYPWYKVGDDYTMEATCTTIASGCFQNVNYLKHLVAPGVESVANMTFSKCPLLESVTFGDALRSFGYRCFETCPKMQSVVIPASNTYLKYDNGVVVTTDGSTLMARFPFVSGTAYTTPATLKTINAYAFYNNDKLQTVEMPAAMDSIGRYAFYGCAALKSMVVPAGVKYLDESTFARCKAMTSVTLPDGLVSVGDGCFYGCYNLEDIQLPASLVNIDDEAFSGLGLTAINIPDNVITIGASAFADCDYLMEITIGASVQSIGDEAFISWFEENPTIYIKALTPPTISSGTAAPFEEQSTIYVPQEAVAAYTAAEAWKIYNIVGRASSSDKVVTLTAAGTLSQHISESEVTGVVSLKVSGPMNGTDFAYLNRMPMIKKLDLAGVTIVAGGEGMVTAAGEFPKHGVRSLALLDSIALPSGLVALGDSALCSTNIYVGDQILRQVVVPATLERIGASAFEARLGLTELPLPSGLTYIGTSAFAGCANLDNVEIPAGVDTIHDYAFSGCTSLSNIKFNEGLKAICEYAFNNCKSITRLTLPNTLDSIGNGGFMSATGLVNLELPDNLRHLGTYVFSFNPSLEYVKMPANLTYIGQSCFASCGALRSATLPAKLKTLNNAAFVMDSALLRVDVPRSIVTVGSTVFERCRSLKLATFAYDYNVPGEDELPDVEVATTKLSTRSSVFANCTSLEAIYIGSRVNFLADKFLANTPNLKKIFVASTTPPDMFAGESAFTSYDADLYVPQASINLYRTNEHWKYFTKIHALENQYNAVGELFDDPAPGEVIVTAGAIEFADTEANVSVTNLSGQLIYLGKGCRIEVAPGMYILTINSKPMKVIVK